MEETLERLTGQWLPVIEKEKKSTRVDCTNQSNAFAGEQMGGREHLALTVPF